MTTMIDLFLVALITIYIVDLSGFTDSWLGFLSAYKGRKISSLKPFSCSLCMVWWVSLFLLLVTGSLSIPMVAFAALLSFLSYPIGQMLIFIREGIMALISKLMDLL